jgi:hypothetical protein
MHSEDDRHPAQCDNWHGVKSLCCAAFKEDEQSVPAANGGKRNDDAIRKYLALHGTNKLMGQQNPWRIRAE